MFFKEGKDWNGLSNIINFHESGSPERHINKNVSSVQETVLYVRNSLIISIRGSLVGVTKLLQSEIYTQVTCERDRINETIHNPFPLSLSLSFTRKENFPTIRSVLSDQCYLTLLMILTTYSFHNAFMCLTHTDENVSSIINLLRLDIERSPLCRFRRKILFLKNFIKYHLILSHDSLR